MATPRENNLRHYHLFARRDPALLIGLDPNPGWDAAEVLGLMVRQAGVHPDAEVRAGADTIDPERTLEALDAVAERLADAAASRAVILCGTGHPRYLHSLYAELTSGLARVGCRIVTPALGRTLTVHSAHGPVDRTLVAREGVSFLERPRERTPAARPFARASTVDAEGGAAEPPHDSRGDETQAVHSHSPLPVRTALEALAAVGEPLPGLVIGDHGWMCGAGQAGLPTVGFADSNDPAPFVAEAEGKIAVTVPLDDAVSAMAYRPIARYLTEHAGLSG